MDEDGDDPGPARRYRPLHRTPPEYQTVIKFLLMASILDSVWVSGPAQTGSPCALVNPGEGDDLGQRPLAAPDAGRDAERGPNHNGIHHLPLEVQEALRKLNISAEDCARDPGAVRLGSVTPAVIRVLGVLLLNAFVVWSDFGAALIGFPAARKAGDDGLHGGASGLGCRDIGGAWQQNMSASWSEQAAALDCSAISARHRANSALAAALERTASAECVAATLQACSANNGTAAADVSAFCGALDSRQKALAAAKAFDEYDEVEVPWLVQTFYIVLLVLMVVGMPCCPAVLENACTFLMC